MKNILSNTKLRLVGLVGVVAIGSGAYAIQACTCTTPGFTPTKVVFTTQPVGGVNSGVNLATQPVVSVEDVSSNVVKASTAPVTLSIASQPGSGASISCTSNPLNASVGIATFAGCKITGTSGTYTLTAASSGLTSATSSSITITGSSGFTPSIFVAQTANGTGDGSSCSNAKAISFFNTAGNWGIGNPIAPGGGVGLCQTTGGGNITTPLTVQGSGTSGNPITIQFETGATIAESFCTSCLTISGKSYITIDGNNTGTLEATANGSLLANKQEGTGIGLVSSDHIIIKNLTFSNLYVHTVASNDGALHSKSQWAIKDVDGNNNTFTGNTIHDTQGGVEEFVDTTNNGTNIHIDHNTFYNIDSTLDLAYDLSGGTVGPVFYNNNITHDFSNWDTNSPTSCADGGVGNCYHHDGIHCFSATSTPAHSAGIYLYDNKFTETVSGAHFTSFMFIESTASGTPCDDSTSPNYIFNNIFIDGVGISNGDFAAGSGRDYIWNNSMVGSSAATSGGIADEILGSTQTGNVDFNNNVSSSISYAISSNPAVTYSAGSPDYNIYANASNGFYCNTNTYSFAQFSSWKTCAGSAGDAHSSTSSDAKLNSDGTVQAGSPVIGAGENLTSFCTGNPNLVPLCSDYNGAARPTTGVWDVGALNH